MKNIEYITAGAGSGKTFTLTEKLSEAIANGLKTDQVILTTFTKAAAEEFKIKAAAKLRKKGLYNEAIQLSGAMIGTIDSVSEAFVRKYWYLLGMSPELNLMGDSEQKFYQTNSLIDSKLITPADLSFFEKVRKSFGLKKKENDNFVDDVDFWKDDLLRIINLSRNYGIKSFAKTEKESCDEIDKMFNNNKVTSITWTSAFPSFTSSKKYKKTQTAPAVVTLPDLKEISFRTQDFPTLKEAATALSAKYYSDGLDVYENGTMVWDHTNPVPKVGFGNSVFLDKSCEPYAAYCNECLTSVYWGNLLKEYVRKICSIAANWQNDYAKYKKAHHLVDFNDVELKFKELLGNSQVQDDIKGQYKLVMVDEFQDCNPLQVEIFDMLSEIIASNGGCSVWVGDEKQSIYGFRGSDMQFIKSVIAKFPSVNAGKNSCGLSQSTLKYSFRSRKKLVDKANSMATKMFGGGTLLPIREVGGEDDLDDALGKSEPAIYNWHSNNASKDKYIADVAEQVKLLINGISAPQNFVEKYGITKDSAGNPVYDKNGRILKNTISAGDIAILARKTADVNLMVDALNKIGVKVNAVESNIKGMAEIQLLMAILNYSLQKSLYSMSQILYLWDNKKVEDVISDRISNVKWNQVPILKKIDEILLESKGLSVLQLIETLLLRLDIWNHVAKWGNVSRRHANINTFLRVVAGYEEHTRLLDIACSVMGFVNYYDSESVDVETPFIKDPDAVSVITYHKSKGLEWPIVILDSLNDEFLNEQRLISREFFGVHSFATNPNAITCAGRDEYLIIFPRVVSGNTHLPEVLKNKISNRLSHGGDIYERVKTERARLLYVGFTRARDYVVALSYGNSAFSMLDYYGVRDIIVDDTNTGDVIFKTDIPTVAPLAMVAATYDEIKNTAVNTGSNADPRYISPSKLGHKHGSVSAQNPVKINDPISLSVGNVPMNEIGTCIHDIYAVFDEKDPNMVAKAEEICVLHNRNDIKPQSGDFINAIVKLYDYLKPTYGQYSELYHELPVMHKLANGQIMNGEIDLLWCLSDKEAVIVDFKSMKDDNTVATDDDLIAKGNSYAPQLCAYKDAVEKSGIKVNAMILFFPLQGKIVELK
ncbi:MAG: UvrD-helicase domain-containing protein [Paludibacteraceae bacterium]|nr:UvrD-helicase domain-containing protein [Paludibacteraceae bacterium]